MCRLIPLLARMHLVNTLAWKRSLFFLPAVTRGLPRLHVLPLLLCWLLYEARGFHRSRQPGSGSTASAQPRSVSTASASAA